MYLTNRRPYAFALWAHCHWTDVHNFSTLWTRPGCGKWALDLNFFLGHSKLIEAETNPSLFTVGYHVRFLSKK